MNRANPIRDGDPESQRPEQDAFFARGWRVYSLADKRYLWEPTSEYLVRVAPALVDAWERRPPPPGLLRDAVRARN